MKIIFNNFKNWFAILLIFIVQSCAVIYMDLKKPSPDDLVMKDLKTGIIFYIQESPGPLITNMVKLEIFQDSSMIENSYIPWFTNKSFSLVEGEYTVNTYVNYFNRKIWKTTNKIKLSDPEIKNFKIKYPTLVTAKPKVTIQ